MPTTPIDGFINRRIDDPKITELFERMSSFIEEVVNYSSVVFRWGIDSIEGGDENIPALLMYRHIFELIDSISVLMRHSCVEPCYIILRSVFESFLNFNYLFEGNFREKGMDFMVWLRQKQLYSLKRFDPKDERYAEYEKKRAKDIILRDMPRGPAPNVEERMKALEMILELPSYRDSCAEYERRSKPPKNWYSMRRGPNDIRLLADYLEFPAQYEILYRSWSELVHGTDIVEDKITVEGPGLVSFSPLRLPTDAPKVTQMTVSFGLSVIRLFTKHFVPARSKDNAEWYQREIRDFYERLNTINIHVI